jgi:hypothetical protein
MVIVRNLAVSRRDWPHLTDGSVPSPGPLPPHLLLRISRHETDPVRIILAAHIQLRRWRRAESGQPPDRIQRRIQAIVAAREALIGARKSLSRTV